MGANVHPGPGEGLPETLARRFFQQLIFALDFCQRQGIANRLVNLLPPGDMKGCLLDAAWPPDIVAGMSPSAHNAEISACMQKISLTKLQRRDTG